jgi:monoamine oxidase
MQDDVKTGGGARPNEPSASPMTRRQLLQLAGMAGGSAAVYRVASALELLPSLQSSGPLKLASARRKRHVLILGAGIAGLVCAFELVRAGHTVEILEASYRAGGRVLTLRNGDVVDEIGNRQVCRFDREPHLYFNAGASRIPTTHTLILGYCKLLGIPLETHVNANTSAWVQYDSLLGGQRIRQREYNADARGFIAELLAKSLVQGSLDAPLTGLERERVLEFVSRYGDLDADHVYRGSPARAGYSSGGLYLPGVKKRAIEFSELLRSDYWQSAMHFGEGEAQSSVLQPVGGMDRIVHAFADRVRGQLKLNAQVIAIQTGDSGVQVTYRQNGQTRTVNADYCLNSIPGQILAGIDHNFSSTLQSKLMTRPRGRLGKIAFQMRERFWEKEGIYGGISWTGQDIGQMQYPSHGFHAEKGIVIGGYYLEKEPSERFQNMSAQERYEAAIHQGERLHPGYASYVENGISVAWYRMNHMLGCTARETDAATLQILRQSEGRHYLIGDQVSTHAGWQESAVLSAHDVLNKLNEREAAA